MGKTEDDFTKEEIQEVVRPIASLISKSEKAQQKLAPGSWQYRMLQGNLDALYIALALMDETKEKNHFAQEDLQKAKKAFVSMISRTENTKTKFLLGTSLHSLQQNRLKALHFGLALIDKLIV